jgi:hypothetical protein
VLWCFGAFAQGEGHAGDHEPPEELAAGASKPDVPRSRRLTGGGQVDMFLCTAKALHAPERSCPAATSSGMLVTRRE